MALGCKKDVRVLLTSSLENWSHVYSSWLAILRATGRKIIIVNLTCNGTIIIRWVTCSIWSDLRMHLCRARAWCVVTSAVDAFVPDTGEPRIH